MRLHVIREIAACFVLLFVVACNDSSATPGDGDAGSEPTPFMLQAARGAELFGVHCAHCHGSAGQGTEDAPRLVGLDEGALPLEPRPEAEFRTTRFETVGDIAAFASVNMPADNPGSLEIDEYFAILAFALSANGIVLEDELTPEVADTLVIPR